MLLHNECIPISKQKEQTLCKFWGRKLFSGIDIAIGSIGVLKSFRSIIIVDCCEHRRPLDTLLPPCIVYRQFTINRKRWFANYRSRTVYGKDRFSVECITGIPAGTLCPSKLKVIITRCKKEYFAVYLTDVRRCSKSYVKMMMACVWQCDPNCKIDNQNNTASVLTTN